MKTAIVIFYLSLSVMASSVFAATVDESSNSKLVIDAGKDQFLSNSLCRQNEKILFNCHILQQISSLCGDTSQKQKSYFRVGSQTSITLDVSKSIGRDFRIETNPVFGGDITSLGFSTPTADYRLYRRYGRRILNESNERIVGSEAGIILPSKNGSPDDHICEDPTDGFQQSIADLGSPAPHTSTSTNSDKLAPIVSFFPQASPRGFAIEREEDLSVADNTRIHVSFVRFATLPGLNGSLINHWCGVVLYGKSYRQAMVTLGSQDTEALSCDKLVDAVVLFKSAKSPVIGLIYRANSANVSDTVPIVISFSESESRWLIDTELESAYANKTSVLTAATMLKLFPDLSRKRRSVAGQL